ncbi:MAG: hypothetical protein AB7K86_14790 [Rhodospirillales bacterium]
MLLRNGFALLLLVALGGCADALYEHVGMTEEAVLKRGQFVKAAPQPDLDPVYCYRTIGAPDCYARPQPGRAEQLIGSYGPAPARKPAN